MDGWTEALTISSSLFLKKLGDNESAYLCSDQSSLFARRNFASLAVQNAPNEVSELTAQMHKFKVTSECI